MQDNRNQQGAGRPPAFHRLMQMATTRELAFPQGDALGVVLSFLSARELVHGRLVLVSKAWQCVLCTLPHSWGLSLNLSWIRSSRIPNLSLVAFAWHRIRVSQQPRGEWFGTGVLAVAAASRLEWL